MYSRRTTRSGREYSGYHQRRRRGGNRNSTSHTEYEDNNENDYNNDNDYEFNNADMPTRMHHIGHSHPHPGHYKDEDEHHRHRFRDDEPKTQPVRTYYRRRPL